MKILPLFLAWMAGSAILHGESLVEEARFIGMLHELQYTETIGQVRKLIPDCPPPHADAGDDNEEIIVKTKLFGHDAVGEFNFHRGVLVSHGFELHLKTYEEAHQAFLQASALLDSKVAGLQSSVALPTDKGDGDCQPPPRDRITIYLNGIHAKADLQLRLQLQQGNYLLGWGAQKVRGGDP